jgi:hypothetical protein
LLLTNADIYNIIRTYKRTKQQRKTNMFSKRTNQWNLPYNSYNPVAEKRRDMENDAAIYKRWRKEQEQKKSEKSDK